MDLASEVDQVCEQLLRERAEERGCQSDLIEHDRFRNMDP